MYIEGAMKPLAINQFVSQVAPLLHILSSMMQKAVCWSF